MADFKDIRSFVPLHKVVGGAAMDMHSDFSIVERRYSHWAARGLEKLTNETLRSGKRYIILTVNRNLNIATLPCDFKEDIFVGYIDSCGEKVPLGVNQNIINNKFINITPCDVECDAKCECCFPKQLCHDLTSTQEIKKININGTDYDETITSTLQCDGEYYVVRTIPFYNTLTSLVEYKTTKEYKTTFDTEACGCIKSTDDNAAKLKANCPDAWCCYCTSCSKDCSYEGGYRIFPENSIIQFDTNMVFDKVYMEYIGSLPKKDGQYVVPEIAFETLVSFIKFKEIENKKGVALSERQWVWEQYTRERNNMERVLGRVKLSTIVNAILTTPKFSYHS